MWNHDVAAQEANDDDGARLPRLQIYDLGLRPFRIGADRLTEGVAVEAEERAYL